MNIDTDLARNIDAGLCLLSLFVLICGLAASWRVMIWWRWVVVAFLGVLVALALALWDAAKDPHLPNAENVPWRLEVLGWSFVGVIVVGAVATFLTVRGYLNTPSGRRRVH